MKRNPAKTAAKSAAIREATKAGSRVELPVLMEPLLLPQESPARAGLHDAVLALAKTSSAFRASLPPAILTSLAGLVRSMNCYYSNLIEGHNTHPVDIERALGGDYAGDRHKRNLQEEARAHIAVQAWIDSGAIGRGEETSAAAICGIHRRFCELLPEELLRVEDAETGEKLAVVPGEFRARHVRVGGHIAVAPGAVPAFLHRFHEVYGPLGDAEAALSAAAAHHRLLWIHPFLDGNGRVARLMSHALLLRAVDTAALWSIARGLARNVQRYKSLLAACDEPRSGDLDGRGSLSERALVAFTKFFLETCLDQVRFMESLCEPRTLRSRILTWGEEEIRLGRLAAHSGRLLDALLYRGEIPRGEIPGILGVSDRHARRAVSELMAAGAIGAESARSPLRLAFPAALAGRWFPGLFPNL